MIVFLTVLWCVILLILVKTKTIQLTLWWKLSPVIWMALLLIILFIPMQFFAPSGPLLVVQYSTPITPNVAGQVARVNVTQNQQVREGDILFEIDPETFTAQRDQVQAQLNLAKVRLEQTQQLVEQDAVSGYELDQYEAQVKQLEAGLKLAEYNLRETKVKAPTDGYITNLALRKGARVGRLAVSRFMTLVEDDRLIAAQIPQAYLRHVKAGQQVEVTFKMFPGKVHSATVDYVVMASATGQLSTSGNMVAPRETPAVPYAVVLKLNDESLLQSLPAGAIGSVAVYTEAGKATHVIRRVMIRMDAFMNYIIPT
ncbi:MAG: hypothetical protein AseanaTS_12590 [Candidatus Pelagadaptatus aseana]|uniref:HlyD family secretion protein n=1 Tax=Candidatus Pelagadaptatus aseana TaxID=3120508 RepID=UPI0039B14F8D